jgi:hypothetical protein
MGCYDTIIVPCPSCGTEEYFQSKSGDCLLREYPLESCPGDILWDVNRHSPYVCEKCGIEFEVNLEVTPPKAIRHIACKDAYNPHNIGYTPIEPTEVPDTLPRGGSGVSRTGEQEESCETQLECWKILLEEYKLDLRDAIKELNDIKEKYYDLIMFVGNKYENESRHETAKRYIIERERTHQISEVKSTV